MLNEKRLENYFAEATKHIQLINEAKEVITLPIKDYNNLSSLEKFAINTLIFRFSKLQDLLGTKIFRSFLEFNKFEVEDKSFLILLKEIEKIEDRFNEIR
jgi:hypothetical protein